MKFVDLETQYQKIKTSVDQKIQQVLNHTQFILGPEVTELEEKLAHYVGAKHCISAASGTDALMMALMALNIGPGDEVITSPFTFFASTEVILLLGATAVFVDIDPRTYNIDAKLIAEKITPKTKAILPINLYGQCADYDLINQIAAQHKIPIIEDAAQSFGATYRGKHSCNLGTVGCTSFFPAKPLGCYGDGGACFTNDDQLAKVLREIRVHGQDRRYHHCRLGITGRLDTIQAAILLAKLEVFDQEILLRQQVADHYNAALKDFCVIPYIEPHNQCVFAQYTVQVENRDTLQEKLQKNNIPTAIHYPIPVHKQLALKEYSNISLPIAEQIAKKVISLPMHPYLKEKEILEIARIVL
jgi:UDP-2-acetamido-2-deoxy-ribo-hexuluronate aminotransferase